MLPFGIMGFMCLQSAILSIFLHETNGQSTIETMAEMGQKHDILLLPSPQDEINNNKHHLAELYLDQQM